MVKYDWALLNGKPINIQDVTDEMRNCNSFMCVDKDCPNPKMAAHINGKRAKHFQHINHTPHRPESILHLTAKKILFHNIQDRINSKSKLTLVYPIIGTCTRLKRMTGIECNVGKIIQEANLTDFYDLVKMEQKSLDFRPDIEILSSKGHDSIFIEVKVDSAISEAKKASNKRIIEISIDKYSDLKKLSNETFHCNDKKIKLINFPLVEKEIDYCRSKERGCPCLHSFFGVYRDGRFVYSPLARLEEIAGYLYNDSGKVEELIWHQIDMFKLSPRKLSDFEILINGVESYDKFDGLIKSCSLCKYAAIDTVKEHIYCKFLKFKPDANYAADCRYYRKQIKNK